jgi:hypothetical protein
MLQIGTWPTLQTAVDDNAVYTRATTVHLWWTVDLRINKNTGVHQQAWQPYMGSDPTAVLHGWACRGWQLPLYILHGNTEGGRQCHRCTRLGHGRHAHSEVLRYHGSSMS